MMTLGNEEEKKRCTRCQEIAGTFFGVQTFLLLEVKTPIFTEVLYTSAWKRV
jgi:hypothetical protein